MADKSQLIRKNDGTLVLPVEGRKPVTFVANDAILEGLDARCIEQAVNAAQAPGVEALIVNPDAHAGYGCPVGSVMVTKEMLYPGMVGPDICCSMSYLQTDLPGDAVLDRESRRALIDAVCARIPTGATARLASKGRRFTSETLFDVATHGAGKGRVLANMGIPPEWASYCEEAAHGDPDALGERLSKIGSDRLLAKLTQIGSFGSGNHFGECEVASVVPGQEELAKHFGVLDGAVGFLSHCGSRGFGYRLADSHFRGLEHHFKTWAMPFPGNDKELVYAPDSTPEGQAYLSDMYLGANFATVNHLLINTLVLEAFREVFPGTNGHLVYHVSHNIGRRELHIDGPVGGKVSGSQWVWRKGATRAFPAKHPSLGDTRYYQTGHPVLLPGDPASGSFIMVGAAGGHKTAFSINHGAGRAMGRKEAKRVLSQASVEAALLDGDILSNCRTYPVDEAPAAYKNFGDVIASVEGAGLASAVAKLSARFVIKDADLDKEGAA